MKTGEDGGSVYTSATRRIAGLAWLSFWILMVGTVHAPWRDLGGLVAESVRYWERFVLASAAIMGCLVGATARDAAGPGMGRSHATLARYLLVIPASVAAASMLWLAATTGGDWVGVVFVGLLAYWAGLDAGIGAWPLIRGRHYSFTRAIESDDDETRAVSPSEANPWR